jgi:epoxyqueuosine reductase
MVRADEIAPRLPDDSRGSAARHPARSALRQSRFLSPAELKARLPELAAAHSFDAVGVAPSASDDVRLARLRASLDAGEHGDMDWMAREPEKRASPEMLWPEARSVILLGTNYATGDNPLDFLKEADRGAISLYALRRDYHDVIKSRLKALATAIVGLAGGEMKVFVDTAPVMEKPLAQQAGLGWQGKHSVLVSRDFGNWLFLGAVYTTLNLAPDAPGQDHCGSCRRCLDICPTNAFPAPYRLDSRRCIAYLTIEHKGPIAPEFRAPLGNRIFGCDDCLAICPWNRFAIASRDSRLALREELKQRDLADLARLDDAAFRTLFAGTPVKRTGRDRFVRNVLIAIGNSREARFIPEVMALLADASPLVRGMAIWALARLSPAEVPALAAKFRLREADPHVEEEWQAALSHSAG